MSPPKAVRHRDRVPKEIAEYRQGVMQKVRKTARLSQRMFAKKIGRKYSYVRARETRYFHVTIDDVSIWAKGADMDAVVLFELLTRESPTETQACPT